MAIEAIETCFLFFSGGVIVGGLIVAHWISNKYDITRK